MSHDTKDYCSASRAAIVCERFVPGETAKSLLREEMNAREYIEALIEAQEFPDAIRVLAHALPRREAVWWACHSVRKVALGQPSSAIVAALAAAEAWVIDPSEENRRAAQAAAEAVGYDSAAGCAAAAAFWSGGSLAPPNVPAVPPGEYLTAHGSSCSVMLAAVTTDPEKAGEKSQLCLRLGLEIAEGSHHWPEAVSTAPASMAGPDPAASTQMPPASKASRSTLNWD